MKGIPFFAVNQDEKESNLSISRPLWKPKCLKRENVAFSLITDTLKALVSLIMS